jgi:hypothetical protein
MRSRSEGYAPLATPELDVTYAAPEIVIETGVGHRPPAPLS